MDNSPTELEFHGTSTRFRPTTSSTSHILTERAKSREGMIMDSIELTIEGTPYMHTSSPKELLDFSKIYKVPKDEDLLDATEPTVFAATTRVSWVRERQRAQTPTSTLEDISRSSDRPSTRMFSSRLNTALKETPRKSRGAEIVRTSDGKLRIKHSDSDGEYLQEVLHADEPVTFFAKNKGGPVKFVYLNRVKGGANPNPYKLVIVPYSEVDKDYYTMSSNGVTYVRSDGHSEFTGMSQWVREADVFEIISRLEVFKNFRFWKSFRKWRSYIRKRRFKANKNKLENGLFLVKPIFSKYLLQLIKMCENDLLKMDLLPVRPHANFGAGPNSHRRVIKQQCTEFIDLVVDLLERACAEVSDPDRIKITSDDFKLKARRKISLRQLMLLEKQKALEKIKITDQVNAEINMIGNFVRLCDYIIIEFLVTLVLTEFNKFYSILQIEKSTVFATSLLFDVQADIQFNPNCETVESLVMEVMKEIVSLEKYVEQSGQKPASVHDAPSVQQFLNVIDQYHTISLNIKEIVENSFNAARAYSKRFLEFRPVFQFGRQWDIHRYQAAIPTLEVFAADFIKFSKWTQDLSRSDIQCCCLTLSRIQPSSTHGILFIDSKALKSSLTPIPIKAQEDLKQLLTSIASERTHSLLDLFKSSISSLSTEPSTLEEFVEFVKLFNPLSARVNECAEEIQMIDDMYSLLDEYEAAIAQQDLERHSLIHTVFGRFKESLATAQILKKKLQPNYVKILESNVMEATDQLQVVSNRLRQPQFSDPRSIPESLLIDLADIRSKVTELKDKVDRYADYSVNLDLEPSDIFEDIRKTVDLMNEVEGLWSAVHKWHIMEEQYSIMPFTTLKKDDIANDLTSVYSKATEILQKAADNLVARNMLDKIEHYQMLLPHILALANPAIKPRHWSKLFETVGQPYDKETIFSLQQLKEYNILSHEEIINEINTLASGEYALETTLENIELTWLNQSFSLMRYNTNPKFPRNIHILTGVDEIQQQLEDQEITLASMLNSEYVAGIRKKVENMKVKLSHVSEILEEWVECQRKWIYLEPIFSQYEVSKQLSSQSTKWKAVDRRWRAIMRNTQKDPKVLVATSQPGLQRDLNESNKVMESILFSLENYLDSKRMVFPRFFFLSNEEIFEIMSQIHEPQTIQPFLSKCFDNIIALEFSENLDQVLGMLSEKGEKLVLTKPVIVEGLVEAWLLNVEDSMQKSVSTLMTKALTECTKLPLEGWIYNYPCQVVTAVTYINFTSKIQSALQSNNSKEQLAQYENVLLKRIDNFTEILQLHEVSYLQRTIVSAALMVDSHCLEMLKKLILNKVNSPFDFEWLKYIHYYWDDKKKKCFMKHLNTTFNYGYEFIGCSSRLVITPQTERSFLAISETLQSHMACHVMGSSGSGKSETIRELARNFGRFCLNFNCSDGLSRKTLTKILSGIIQTGTWGVFSNLFCLDFGILSVFSQHLKAISNAISEHAEKFILEGKTLRVDENYACFVISSKNHEHQHPSIPDSLRQYFRSVTLPQPDVELIAEVLLLSKGFQTSRLLSKKLAYFYSVLENHFIDCHQNQFYGSCAFGLRSIQSVIELADNYRQKDSKRDEIAILVKAIHDTNISKFKGHDTTVFCNLLAEMFPDYFPAVVKIDEVDVKFVNHLRITIVSVLKSRNLQPIDPFVDKIVQLYDTMSTSRGVILVGDSSSGKSTAFNVLSQVIPNLNSFSDSNLSADLTQPNINESVRITIVNPTATLGAKDLFGNFCQQEGNEWKDGLISKLIRKAGKEDPNKHLGTNSPQTRHWIVFDGIISDTWTTALNSLLDENQILTLMNGERIVWPELMHMLFETPDLKHAPPSIVSRCGIVAFQSSDIGWKAIYQSWSDSPHVMKKLKEDLRQQMNLLVNTYFEKAAEYMRSTCQRSLSLSQIHLIQSFCSIADGLIAEDFLQKNSDSAVTLINFCFVFSLTWSVGGHLMDLDKRIFDAWVRSNLKNVFLSSEDNLIYDYGISGDGKITTWKKIMDGGYSNLNSSRDIISNHDNSMQNPVVHNSDTQRYSFLLKLLSHTNKHTLVLGPSGCGKNAMLHTFMSQPAFTSVIFRFTPETTSNHIQDVIESQFENKRKNVLGPPVGKKMIICGHNLHLLNETSNLDVYEMLYQLATHNGFYDAQQLFFLKVRDFQLVFTMGVEHKQQIPTRLLEKFNILSVSAPSHEQLSSILHPMFKNILLPFSSSDLLRLINPIIDATIYVFENVSEKFKPKSNTCHYQFSLHSLKKLVQGFQQIKQATPSYLLKLWRHEMTRVFGDCLVEESERTWLANTLSEASTRFVLKTAPADLMAMDKDCIFLDLTGMSTQVGYVEHEREDIRKLLANSLNQNQEVEKYILTDAHIDRLVKIMRIMQQPRGHALLLSPSGGGIRTLVKASAGFLNIELFTVKMKNQYTFDDFVADAKNLMIKCGIEEKPVVFYITESELAQDILIDRIEHLINFGNFPLLLSHEDMDHIIQDSKSNALTKGYSPEPDQIYQYFTQNIQRNFHFMVRLNPKADKFQERIYNFPSLVNHFTILWFDAWTHQELLAIASQLISKNTVKIPISESVGELAVQIFESCHQYHKHNPPSRLYDMLTLFGRTLAQKKSQNDFQLSSIRIGLKKMVLLSQIVATTKDELATLTPLLQKVSDDTKNLEEAIVQNTKIVEEFWKVLHQEQINVTSKNTELGELTEDAKKAQEEFDKVVPVLNAAIAGIRSISKNDIAELRSYLPNPPERVQKILEAVCILQGRDPTLSSAEAMLGGSMLWMINFDKENVKDEVLASLKKYIINPEFTPAGMDTKAGKWLCSWVIGIYKYCNVYKLVQPKRAKVATTETQLRDLKSSLEEKQSKLSAAASKLEEFKQIHKASNEKRTQLETKSNELIIQLKRAEKLVESLEGREQMWTARSKELEKNGMTIVGNCILYAASITFLGSLDSPTRTVVVEKWKELSQNLLITVSEDFSLNDIFSDIIETSDWIRMGLPPDPHSHTNGLIVSRSMRWPYIIDPEGVASKWIRNLERINQIKVLDPSVPNFLRTVEASIVAGRPVLIENSCIGIHPDVETLLVTFGINSRKSEPFHLDFGGKVIQYNPNFKLFIVTPVTKPRLSDEVLSCVNVVNFSLNFMGLVEQLLNHVVRTERSEIQQQKDSLLDRFAVDRKEQKELDDKMIELVCGSEGALVENDALVNELSTSRGILNAIEKRLIAAKEMEDKCDFIRNQYRLVAGRAAVLYDLVKEFAALDPMYLFDLQQFTGLLRSTLMKSATSSKIQQRITNLLRDITYAVFTQFGKCMAEKHRAYFGFMLAVRIAQQSTAVTDAEWCFFVNPQNVAPKQILVDAPTESWVTEDLWTNITKLERVCPGIADSFVSKINEWKSFIHSELSISTDRPLPDEWDKHVTDFQRILIVQTVNGSKFLFDEVVGFVHKQLGFPFLDPFVVDIDRAFSNSAPNTPIIFILPKTSKQHSNPKSLVFDSMVETIEEYGLDVNTLLSKFAYTQGMRDRFRIIALGSSKNFTEVENQIQSSINDGYWVLLQNCHRVEEWLPQLANVMYASQQGGNLSEPSFHSDFRLWMMTESTENFPLIFLQKGHKLSADTPLSMKGSMVTLYRDSDDQTLNTCKRPAQYKKLVFGLNFFHSVLWTRRNYDFLGWFGKYDWSNIDHSLVIERIRQHLNSSDERNEEVPYKALLHLTSEIYYGGHVTDPHDLLCLKAILSDLFVPAIMDDKYAFTSKEGYLYPTDGSTIGMESYLSKLPVLDSPETVGINDFVWPYFENKESKHITDAVKCMYMNTIQPVVSTPGSFCVRIMDADHLVLKKDEGNADNDLLRFIEGTLPNVPRIINLEITQRLPSATTLAIPTFEDLGQPGDKLLLLSLQKEIHLLSKILKLIHVDLQTLKEGLQGNFFLMKQTQQVQEAILKNTVPPKWKLYTTRLDLTHWLEDLLERVSFFQKWLQGMAHSITIQRPKVFWIGAFSNPIAIFNYAAQRFAKTSHTDIESVFFDFDPIPANAEPSEDAFGIIIRGLHLLGAKWEPIENRLTEFKETQLTSRMPDMLCKPTKLSKTVSSSASFYSCPVYRTSARGPSNFVTTIKLPSDVPEKHWLKRGLMLVTHLDALQM